MRFAVIGAGAVGARAARQLLSTPDVSEVVVRDPRRERLDAVVEALGDGAVADPGPWSSAPQVDVVVACVPPGAHVELARSAIAAGSDLVSTSDSITDVQGLLELDHEARERSRTIVAGAGFAPGLTCVLARHGANLFDQVDEVHVSRVGTGGPSCARHHHAALAGRSLDWRDGRWERRRGGSGRELNWFPDPIGGRDCYRAALPDALLLVPAIDGVQRVTARLAANRRDRLTSRLPMLRRPHDEGGPGGVRVEVRGLRAGVSDTQVFGVMDRPAVAAGAVAAVAAIWLATERVTGPGTAGLAALVDSTPFLHELRSRGVRAALFEGAAA